MTTPFSDAYWQRFSGIARLYGRPALETFANAHFCVIGLGGWALGLLRHWLAADRCLDLGRYG